MVLVHINLDELTPRELGSERFEKRRDRAAWNAPGCGELHDDGAIAGRSEDGVELGLRRGLPHLHGAAQFTRNPAVKNVVKLMIS
jgi:hypothetical protein